MIKGHLRLAGSACTHGPVEDGPIPADHGQRGRVAAAAVWPRLSQTSLREGSAQSEDS